MITYLFYSSISLAFLLLVYRFMLEKEKRFTFNRIFLLWSLVFSLTIPLLPVGIAPVEMQWAGLFISGENISAANTQQLNSINMNSDFQPPNEMNRPSESSSEMPFQVAFLIYMTVTTVLFLRLVRSLHELQSKTKRESAYMKNGVRIVLLTRQVIPHSFLNAVFVNKKRFEQGKIPEEVLAHEVAHVRQMHSLDILFVEALKIIFWFNPLLYLYKHCIAQNHEYLADQAVLSKGTGIQQYQRMLLKTMEEKTMYSLASSFNFSLTKRRLQMMTQSKTKVKFFVKLTMLVPLFAGLSLMLGCEPASNQNPSDIDTSNELSIEILEDNALLMDENPMTLDELNSLLSEMPESPRLVRMEVSPEAEFGIVTDVQSILRKHEAFRISYSTKDSDGSSDLTLPPAPPEPDEQVDTQNLMQILMNSDGRLLMNEKPAELNEVKEKIKQFVNKDSSGPNAAVITIKTLKETPYELYAKLLNEVRGAYDDLRNEAAQDQFGMAFSSLEQNSTERETIQEMYPMKLSVVPPEKN